jgi:hypothetical protein
MFHCTQFYEIIIYTMHCRPECKLAFSPENAYFGTAENKVSDKRLVELGKCFAKAIKKYAAQTQ